MKDLTDIICILDKSGSMSATKNDAIGGFNQFLAEQKALPGKATMTLTVFDTVVDCCFSRKPLEEVELLTEATYSPQGMTALLDAIGVTVQQQKQVIEAKAEADRPEKVIVVIITDGEENSSHEYTRAALAAVIEELQTQHKWEFLYLGANQDAFLEAGKIGIPQASAVAFNSTTGQGVRAGYTGASARVANFRAGTGKPPQTS